MLPHNKMPYSRKALEDLAVALNVNSAAIWFSPDASRIEIRESLSSEEEEEEDPEAILSN